MTQSTSNWQPGQGGLEKLKLSHTNGASAEIYRHGAHLTSWQSRRGREWIFLSRKAQFQAGKAIRGGVPVIFPQFNERGPGPRHGFARTTPWQLALPTDPSSHCRLRLAADQATQALWPFQFEALYDVSLEDEGLTLSLTVRNLDEMPFTFTAALHTYFRLDDLHSASLAGLKHRSFWDNDGSPFDQRRPFDQEQLEFAGAIDRVFFDVTAPLELNDGGERLRIENQGFQDVVVWNPGFEAASAMADMEGEEYRFMLCVEAAQIDKPITLAPGGSWTGAQKLTAG